MGQENRRPQVYTANMFRLQKIDTSRQADLSGGRRFTRLVSQAMEYQEAGGLVRMAGIGVPGQAPQQKGQVPCHGPMAGMVQGEGHGSMGWQGVVGRAPGAGAAVGVVGLAVAGGGGARWWWCGGGGVVRQAPGVGSAGTCSNPAWSRSICCRWGRR